MVVNSGLLEGIQGPAFITATGGTVLTTCGNCKVHTFTGPGSFIVSCGGNDLGSDTVELFSNSWRWSRLVLVSGRWRWRIWWF
jgi:hypothetical protein